MKKIVLIHDLVAVGHCASTIIIPIATALKTQCCLVPTTLFSAHGAYPEPIMSPQISYLKDSLAYFDEREFLFDGVFTGFFTDVEQIEICKEYLKTHPNLLRLVDPIMGDWGEVYRIRAGEIVSSMQELVRNADIITPNPTEAALLLNLEYKPILSMEEARGMAVALTDMGPNLAIITGCEISDGRHYNVYYDKKREIFNSIEFYRYPEDFPGTGDVFAGIFFSLFLAGKTTDEAIEIAGDFISKTVALTLETGGEIIEGLRIEETLGLLIK